jgi:hypothetical protein
MGLFDEKTEGQKSRDIVPLSCFPLWSMLFVFIFHFDIAIFFFPRLSVASLLYELIWVFLKLLS